MQFQLIHFEYEQNEMQFQLIYFKCNRNNSPAMNVMTIVTKPEGCGTIGKSLKSKSLTLLQRSA